MVNAAIVGLGWWGRTLIESVQGSSDELTFVGGATRTLTPVVEEFAAANELRLYDGLDAILADPTVDAVVLATPHSMHSAQTVAAAAAGKHVFCEKPFTLSKRQAEEAVAAVRKANVVLGLGYSRRFHPEMAKLRDMIHRGELGTILHVESTMAIPGSLFMKPDHWRANKQETPCGGLMPIGVHAVDAMIDLCGPIDHVFAQSFRRAAAIDADDTTSILFRMKDGMSGYLGILMATGPGFHFQVFGSKGSLRLDGVGHGPNASPEDRRTRLFGTCRFQPVKGEPKTWQAGTTDILRDALEAFAAAAEGGPTFPISLDQMIHGAAVTDAIVSSAASGKVVHVE
jgi:predicted dehydrogenase